MPGSWRFATLRWQRIRASAGFQKRRGARAKNVKIQLMVEQLRPGVSAKDARVCLFDFDGTLSLIRSGWMDVMVPMMVEILADLKTGETRRAAPRHRGGLRRPPHRQADHVPDDRARRPDRDAAARRSIRSTTSRCTWTACTRRSHDRLEELRGGGSPEKYLVPGSRALLESLKERGLKLYLASGTDQEYMRDEAHLLDVDRYFDGGVYGALDDYKSFSKKILIQRMIASAECRGEEFLGFGDGYVEIENVKEVGGIAVGVATDEPECQVVDEWKRTRLAGVGADFIIPNFLCREQLLATLFPEPMASKYPLFDRSRLVVKPLAERVNDLQLDHWLALDDAPLEYSHPQLGEVAARIVAARRTGAARILMMGAHVLRAGVNRHIIDLMERGFIDHIAMNGAGAIHDYELARIGATTESVARYIRTGEFGLWRETGELNDWIAEAARLALGPGRERRPAHRGERLSAPRSQRVRRGLPRSRAGDGACGHRLRHPARASELRRRGAGRGQLSRFSDLRAHGRAAGRRRAAELRLGDHGAGGLSEGAGDGRNVAHQQGRAIRNFTTAVFDLVPIGGDIHARTAEDRSGLLFPAA